MLADLRPFQLRVYALGEGVELAEVDVDLRVVEVPLLHGLEDASQLAKLALQVLHLEVHLFIVEIVDDLLGERDGLLPLTRLQVLLELAVRAELVLDLVGVRLQVVLQLLVHQDVGVLPEGLVLNILSLLHLALRVLVRAQELEVDLGGLLPQLVPLPGVLLQQVGLERDGDIMDVVEELYLQLEVLGLEAGVELAPRHLVLGDLGRDSLQELVAVRVAHEQVLHSPHLAVEKRGFRHGDGRVGLEDLEDARLGLVFEVNVG
mmetsp:Transcript_18144/g.31004  ORF Transcript_18144/g.31004 Transcript_18144/m.31004 type:complete len:262 (-) Transcript_18144:1243-2028(-)